eukprot:NODE_202_length_13094_cov_1.571528.p8 type:complete len:245 gc:universal NODE_202_length_13094_cov_1.571528:3968-3234(-)
MDHSLNSLILEFLGIILIRSASSQIIDGTLAALHILALFHGLFDFAYLKKKDYGWYLSVIAIHGVLWYIAPKLALVVFLSLSAYHFGIEDAAFENKGRKYLFKGLAIICGILHSDRDTLYLNALVDIKIKNYFLLKGVMVLFYTIYSAESKISVKFKSALEMAMFSQLNSFYAFSVYYLCSHSYYSTISEFHLINKAKIIICTFIAVFSSVFLLTEFDRVAFVQYLNYLSCLASPHIILSIIKK